MVQGAAGLVSLLASVVAILTGVVTLADRWAQRRVNPAASPASPPDLLVPTRSHAVPAPASSMTARRSVASRFDVAQGVQAILAPLAWFVAFVAGSNAFSVLAALLIATFPRAAAIAQTTGLQVTMTAVDVAAAVIVTNFLSLFLVSTSGWRRRGAVIAALVGFAVPNLDFFIGLVRG